MLKYLFSIVTTSSFVDEKTCLWHKLENNPGAYLLSFHSCVWKYWWKKLGTAGNKVINSSLYVGPSTLRTVVNDCPWCVKSKDLILRVGEYFNPYVYHSF